MWDSATACNWVWKSSYPSHIFFLQLAIIPQKVYKNINTLTHTYIHTWILVRIIMYSNWIPTLMHVYTYIHAYIRTYIHTVPVGPNYSSNGVDSPVQEIAASDWKWRRPCFLFDVKPSDLGKKKVSCDTYIHKYIESAFIRTLIRIQEQPPIHIQIHIKVRILVMHQKRTYVSTYMHACI